VKVVILAGGKGTRISEESQHRPKPMIEIGGRPILWHIMKLYGAHGLDEFIICLGYKGQIIKDYFVNYALYSSDVTVDTRTGQIEYHSDAHESWKVTLVDTGFETMTGGRLKRIAGYLPPGEPFCMTYGDGLANVDISALLSFHRSHGAKATLTAVASAARFGAISTVGSRVTHFVEKPPADRVVCNGGFFVLDPSVIQHISDDSVPWEGAPLEHLAVEGQLMAYEHAGFWQPMDNIRDHAYLESLWQSGTAPWKCWT